MAWLGQRPDNRRKKEQSSWKSCRCIGPQTKTEQERILESATWLAAQTLKKKKRKKTDTETYGPDAAIDRLHTPVHIYNTLQTDMGQLRTAGGDT